MPSTFTVDEVVLTHVGLAADYCPRSQHATRVGCTRPHRRATRQRPAAVRQKHAMGFRGFCLDSRRGHQPGNVQVTSGVSPVSLGRNVGVTSYYDPNTAQFLTPDPLNAETGSRYGYADNNPINNDDPSGLVCGSAFGSGSYNPDCFTGRGYDENCTGSEFPTNCPVATCPHASESHPTSGRTSYCPCPSEEQAVAVVGVGKPRSNLLIRNDHQRMYPLTRHYVF